MISDKTEMYVFDVYPKVFAVGKKSAVTMESLGARVRFEPGHSYKVEVCPYLEGRYPDYPDRPNRQMFDVVCSDDGRIRLEYTFPAEEEYYLRVFDGENRLVQLNVYAVESDLVGRYPFRGDLHMHTNCSDGNESPQVVAANYRKIGYDFLAITDHRRMWPSLEVMETYAVLPTEYLLVPGEEVHMPKDSLLHRNDVHIVNFGGEYSVNALVDSVAIQEKGRDPRFRTIRPGFEPPILSVEQFHKEIDEKAASMDIPEGVERFAYACCCWIFDKIRDAGGLGIFAHPYWTSDVQQVPETFVEYLMKTRPFDAFEVLGGENYFEHNGFQTIRYYEDRAKGRKYPIVGSTDSHSSLPMNRNGAICSTIVFSPENERKALISSIKDFYSVAVDTISAEWRIVGDMRLVRYAAFLQRWFFPLHDELTFEEGRAMLSYARGNAEELDVLKAINGRMRRQREKYFDF
ncbi:MAG: hypothetical protein K6G71_00130 [Clostridiales bacterium]|nr:hypothetical protein [Clostridiales bacterium]